MTFASRRPAYLGSAIVVAALIWFALVPKVDRKTEAKSAASAQPLLKGATMGTTYSIRYWSDRLERSESEVQQIVDDELRLVNQQMSTYIADSEISRFNDSPSTDWFSVSRETAEVVELSLAISRVSNGAFDVTAGPIVDLWGFGPDKSKEDIPTDADVEAAKARVGFEKLAVQLDPPALKKSQPSLRIDLSAIAKGHGVDRVAHLLGSLGIANYFVEIGGEIVTLGTRRDGKPWQVGIEAPRDDSQSIQTVIGLSDKALATSGDYRNFFRKGDRRFSHTMDPATGRPVTHALASASVVADNCAEADAIATCMMVMGQKEGLALAESKKWAVFLIERTEGQFSLSCSTEFARQFPSVCQQVALKE